VHLPRFSAREGFVGENCNVEEISLLSVIDDIVTLLVKKYRETLFLIQIALIT
jgi:hypothetical protein